MNNNPRLSPRRLRSIIPVILLMTLSACATGKAGSLYDTAWWKSPPPMNGTYHGVKSSSLYIPMRDGVRIAADVHFI